MAAFTDYEFTDYEAAFTFYASIRRNSAATMKTIEPGRRWIVRIYA